MNEETQMEIFPNKNGYVQHMCCACGAVNVAHVQNMCKLHSCAEHVQASAISHICATSVLLVYMTCAACTHECNRYAAQVSLACVHDKACCKHAAYTHASY